MLDHCSISHKGGLVLWTRSFTPSSPLGPVNALVREALIEGQGRSDGETEGYEKDGYAIRWTTSNEMELIFVVAYQRFLHLSYIPSLLAQLKSFFLKLFTPFLLSLIPSLHATGPTLVQVEGGWDFDRAFRGWDKVVDRVLKSVQEESKGRSALPKPVLLAAEPAKTLPPPDLVSEDTHTEEEITRNVEALKTRLRGRGALAGGRRGGKRGKKPAGTPGSDSGSETFSPAKPKKAQRKWGDSALSQEEIAALDYSSDAPPSDGGAAVVPPAPALEELVDQSSMGRRNKEGMYEVADLESPEEEEEGDDILLRAFGTSATQEKPAQEGWFGNIVSRLTGSRMLTDQELQPVLGAMKEHLMRKNVAAEIADKVVESVGRELRGKKVTGFKGIKTEVRAALSASITRILTPKTSTDLLLSIRAKRSSSLLSSPVPYSLTFVGVNGVGKSTNLSKVAFWLLQNGLEVLVAACDTFRSGAVEQLRVHVRNLTLLGGAQAGGGRRVELFEKGYGKDAAGIAREAIAYAKENAFDVVLIDTAGRMQDNEPLMRALSKLVAVNNPDKIIFVGEALVGNEAVDQLTKFDRSLKDFSASSGLGAGRGRGIDGMLVTKWDTVDDKVGAALSMTYVTGQPILFVGCGQTYTDLRQLRVGHIVDALLRD
ncbi:P-loop containing nucleoside triphosphate hydrolase protein [Dacryopinax primogenitus]|uniref:p-loop containing nucleoside triphosphate hydrolase protein n=1 Tax=Dacryopinax primogenitus (strain DJM 731) TaxID=1858805 RepID=M5FY19_DACPD|nr:P-loop containing nucleoside triphosphate hydrolase protein [Dacryopinax primogenitus]EJT98456.1 P-loop containing nucleoside triphosphate hydrolase protein [Dacryopinax primogenitus]